MSKQHPIHNDDRYSIQQEYTGAAKPQWVARFCGEWIGASQFYGSALVQAVSHNARRNGALTLAAEV
jgi:hypothetical protein|tara:strand:- start:63 stop:263 length:201 start_codon:yes stop_codon:yes gene_type:complete